MLRTPINANRVHAAAHVSDARRINRRLLAAMKDGEGDTMLRYYRKARRTAMQDARKAMNWEFV